MIETLFISNNRAELLLLRNYHGNYSTSVAEAFSNLLEKTKSGTPILVDQERKYLYISREGLYYVAVVTEDMSNFLIIEFLHRFYNLCKDFCGTVNEHSIRKNLLLVLEILDEVVDCGVIQQTATEKIKPFIQSEPILVPLDVTEKSGLFGVEKRVVPSSAANKPVIQSRSHVELRRNEVFIDVIERITALFGADGSLIRSQVTGQILMKSFLAGSPLVKMGISEHIVMTTEDEVENSAYGSTLLENCQVHPNVKFDPVDGNILTITPPQGEFSVVKYQLSSQSQCPFPCRLTVTLADADSARDVELVLRLYCDIPATAKAVNITVTVPLPKSCTGITQRLEGSGHSAEYQPSEKRFVWKISSMSGNSEERAQFKILQTNRSTVQRAEYGPVMMDFEISNFVPSNMQLVYIRVFESGQSYVPYRWVRYATLSDSYAFRL